MAFVFLQSASASNEGINTAVDITLTLTSGSLLVGWAKHEGTTTTETMAKSDATNAFTMDTEINHANGDLHGRIGYLFGHSMSGSTTLRFSVAAARPYKRFLIMEFSYTATPSYDAGNQNQSNGATLASGNITTTGTDEVVIGTFGEYFGETTNTEQINGVAATGRVDATYSSMWYRILTSTFTGGQATANFPIGGAYISAIIGIKAVAGGGTPSFIFRRDPMAHLLVR